MIKLSREQLLAGARSVAIEVGEDWCGCHKVGCISVIEPSQNLGGWKSDPKCNAHSVIMKEGDIILRALVLATLNSE